MMINFIDINEKVRSSLENLTFFPKGRIKIFCNAFIVSITCFCCTSSHHMESKVSSGVGDKPLAFPGAEGFGKYTTGGRGGKIILVTTLNDAGPGSFRKAATSPGSRIIVFTVSGTIHLLTKINIAGNCTIAGQSAPGDGICIADRTVTLSGDNIIVRYMRFRMGDKYANEGMIDGAGSDDAFGGNKVNNIIIDHCSMSWSEDEVFSIYRGDSTTLQWNLMAEPLNYSYHFETGDKDFEHHGYGGIWGGNHLTAHHNLFAHCASRNPRFNGTRLGASQEFADFRNNLIYDWGHNNIYGGEAGNYNIVNNYFKYGPNTAKSVKFRIINPSRTTTIPYGKWYVNGNYVDGSGEVTQNNYLGIQMSADGTEIDKKLLTQSKAFDAEKIPEQNALEAYDKILHAVGASLHRDTMDARIINDVKNRTGKFIDVQGGYPHGTSYEQTLSAWPYLNAKTAQLDSDRDGMPDEWEKKNGLNPGDALDASGNKLSKNYTNIEIYLNDILQ